MLQMAKKGKLIVFEGTDGSGKTTQAKLLFSYFQKNKIKTKYISFPRYETVWGKMIRKFLNGEFGTNVDPYVVSMLYAGDRANAKDEILEWLDLGNLKRQQSEKSILIGFWMWNTREMEFLLRIW